MLLKDISVQLLLDEYHFYRSKIDRNVFFDSHIHDVLKRELAYFNDFLVLFLKNLAYLKVQQNEKVIILAQRLYNSGFLREKAILSSSIARLFAQLFDLYVFKRIIESDIRHILLIAGYAHTQHLADMIIMSRARRNIRYGMSFHCQPQEALVALCRDHLNVFTP